MPGFDNSGPMGNGPLTGGGRGFCSPSNTNCPPKFIGGFGRGRRGGFGPGRGMGLTRGISGWNQHSYPEVYTPDPAKEINILKSQEGFLKNRLQSIHKRILELEKQDKNSSASGETDA